MLKTILRAALAATTSIPVLAAGSPDGPVYSPYVEHRIPVHPLFGDTHLHTSQSFDAVAFGTRLGPDEAYQFARGEEVVSNTGQPARLSRPLDFMVVADHAELMGVMGEVLDGNPAVMGDDTVRKWHTMLKKGGDTAMQVYYAMVASAGGGTPLPAVLTDKALSTSIWEKNIAAAERYNSPGEFTALIGYEWSSNTGGNNLHRVVVYRDGAERARTTLPFSSWESDNPEDLWAALKAYEAETGGRVLAIPHNANLSNGLMFPRDNPNTDKPITLEYARTRAGLEPLVEVTQIKGDGEAHPYLSPTDEFADFETWDRGNLDLSADKTPQMLEFEYARSALKLGLLEQQRLGVNPYQFGMIGSTDAHTSLAAVAEDNFFGKLPHAEPSPERATHAMAKFGDKAYMGWEMSASGYAAVWAVDNTRESIWDAMMRRETYATTGPRMTVRFFGGWDFHTADITDPELARLGYSKGVPMGGELSVAPDGKSPGFLLAATRDPMGANLDRIQVVKGWLDSNGELQEKVYDVAWSGDRKPGAGGKLPPVGNTVDVPNATFTNSIGSGELATFWTDPAFDPGQLAYYYARVIEIPTPRWTAYDAKFYQLKLPPDIPTIVSERAYTSPIWYTPKK
jgi:hypothetical protein